MRIALALLFLGLLSFSPIQAKHYAFRLLLKDKGKTSPRMEQPERFLSAASLVRRSRQGIPLADTDIPISSDYLRAIAEDGSHIVVQSKWLSSVVVRVEDSAKVERLKALPFVKRVCCVWSGELPKAADVDADGGRKADPNLTFNIENKEEKTKAYHGAAALQIEMLDGAKLHQAGFRGENMTVAILDEGFENVDRIALFDSSRIVGTKNIINPQQSVFERDDHGTEVLSCMATNMPHVYVGTAPKADYWLIRTEDASSEYPIEEDYWVAGLEFADSVGVDVVSSSLGYFQFDEELEEPRRQSDLDGKTAFITRGAQLAISKGILLFSSAGNEGDSDWGALTFPADAPDVLTIGSITRKKKTSSFSSPGFVRAGYVKPDLVALGTNAAVVSANGVVCRANGTSFATPIVAGLGVCLWQALPHLTSQEVVSLLRQSACRYRKPTQEQGYGIPQVYKYYKKKR